MSKNAGLYRINGNNGHNRWERRGKWVVSFTQDQNMGPSMTLYFMRPWSFFRKNTMLVCFENELEKLW